MGFLDRLSEGAEKVAKQAEKALEQGKTKVEELQLERQMDGLAKKIGYMEYTPVWGPGSANDSRLSEGYFWVDSTTISNDPIGSVPSSPGGKIPQPPSNITIR